MAVTWPAKEESEIRPYGLNWAARLGAATILTSALTVVSGGVGINSQANDGTTMTCVISGGSNGTCAVLSNIITTSDGYTYEEEINLAVLSSECIESAPSTTTKRTVVQMAYEECGLPGYEFTETPEELFSGVRRLDATMSEWLIQAIDVGYNFPAILGQSDPDDESGLPDYAVTTAAGYLAMRLAPVLGKTLSSDQKRGFAMALVGLKAKKVVVPRIRLPRSTPRGAGNKSWNTWQPYIVEASGCGDCA